MAADPQLRALLDLQHLDTTLDQLRHRRAHLPEAAALAELDAEAERLELQRGDARARRDGVAVEREALEAELAATETRAAQVGERMYSGAVSAARELQAMAADVEGLRSRASGLEDRVLALLEEQEPLDAVVDGIDEELAALGRRRDAAAAALGDAQAGVDAELGEVSARRDGAAAGVPGALLARYEQIRTRLGGVAVAPLVGGSCGGCHLTLPATELDAIRHQPPDAVVTCDQCGRILVRS